MHSSTLAFASPFSPFLKEKKKRKKNPQKKPYSENEFLHTLFVPKFFNSFFLLLPFVWMYSTIHSSH